MTEIPEHLLKRSKARRAAASGGGDGGEGDAAAATEPAAEKPAAVEKAAAAPVPAQAAAPVPEPEPLPPYVEAAKRRRKAPFWGMALLVALPVWAVVYVQSLRPPSAGANDPIVLGEQVYQNCASCHGADGGGGVGPQFTNGYVLKTWPQASEQIKWVEVGSDGWPGNTYGAENAPKKGGMPAWKGTLSDEEIALVVRYERQVFGGEDPAVACKITEPFYPDSCANPG